jgi:hypothetical protein
MQEEQTSTANQMFLKVAAISATLERCPSPPPFVPRLVKMLASLLSSASTHVLSLPLPPTNTAIRYGEAIEIYERVSAASLDVALLKWSVKGLLLPTC